MARKLLLKDAAAMALIIGKMDIKSEMTQLTKDIKEGTKSQEEIGVNLIFMLINGASKKGVVNDLYDFIGSVIEMPGKDVAELPLDELISKIKEVADVESWTTFFKSAAQSILSN